MQMIQLNTALNNIFVMFVISLVTTGPFLEISSNLKPHASPQLSQLTLFRWIPVASYDNSQSDIDVMFEYKYVSIPTGISFWPTNILQKFVYIFRPYLVPPIVLYLRHVTPSIMPKVHGGHIVVWGDVQRVWHICYCGGNNAGVSWSLIQILSSHTYPMYLTLAQLQSPQPQLKDVRRQASGRSSVLSLASLQGISSM